MSGHLSAQRIERYQQGRLAPAELLSVGDHLAGCADCRQQLGGTESLQRAFGAFGAQLLPGADSESAHHLSAELMTAYVDNDLDDVDRAIADFHVEGCPECHSELLELRQLKTALIGLSAAEQAPKSAPTRNRLAALWSPRAHWLPIPAAALVVLAFLWLAVIPLRNQVTQLNAQLNELRQSNDELRDTIASLSGLQNGPTGSGDPSVDPPNSDQPIVVSLNDGFSVVALDKQGRLTGLKSLPPTYEQLVKTVLITQRVKASPLLADLVGKRDVLMGSPAGQDGFALKGPVSTVIESDRPTFRWNPLGGATTYVITVYNSTSRETIVSQPISATEWIPEKPLERGVVYAWEVTATRDGREVTVPIPPMPQARFRVLDKEKVDELNRARRSYRGSHLVLGILYAEAGLIDQAKQEFEALVAANPDSLTAQKLLRSVKRGNQ